MSTTDKSIKVIKREDRKSLAEAGDSVEPRSKTATQTRREILRTITAWIEDQREAKKEFLRRSSF
jgi:hypothetical protein